MTRNTTGTATGEHEHALEPVEEIQINPEHIIKCIENDPHDNGLETVLTVNPPFDATATASITQKQPGTYSLATPAPYHIDAWAVIEGNDKIGSHKYPSLIAYPDDIDTRHQYEIDTGNEIEYGETDEDYEEYRERALEAWRERVRSHLNTVDEITLGYHAPPEVGTTTVTVTYE